MSAENSFSNKKILVHVEPPSSASKPEEYSENGVKVIMPRGKLRAETQSLEPPEGDRSVLDKNIKESSPIVSESSALEMTLQEELKTIRKHGAYETEMGEESPADVASTYPPISEEKRTDTKKKIETVSTNNNEDVPMHILASKNISDQKDSAEYFDFEEMSDQKTKPDTASEKMKEEQLNMESETNRKTPQEKINEHYESYRNEETVNNHYAQYEPEFDYDAAFSPEALGFTLPRLESWKERMSDGGRNFARQIYERGKGLGRFIGVDKISSRMGAAFQNFWGNHYETKAARYKSRMNGFDLSAKTLMNTREKFNRTAEELRRKNLPGASMIDLRLKRMDRQIIDIHNQRDRIQSQFEKVDNRSKEFLNRRDHIADKLIAKYERETAPMERELEVLNNAKNRLDLAAAVLTADHHARENDLREIEEQVRTIQLEMGNAGFSIGRTLQQVKPLLKIIDDGRDALAEEKQHLSKRMKTIDGKIATMNNLANPYRDRRDRFARLKQQGAIDFDVSERTHERTDTWRAQIRSYGRTESQEPVEHARSLFEELVGKQTKEHKNVSETLQDWFAYLRAEKNPVVAPPTNKRNEKRFMQALLSVIRDDRPLKKEDFRDILVAYYRTLEPAQRNTKKREVEIRKSIETFFKRQNEEKFKKTTP